MNIVQVLNTAQKTKIEKQGDTNGHMTNNKPTSLLWLNPEMLNAE